MEQQIQHFMDTYLNKQKYVAIEEFLEAIQTEQKYTQSEDINNYIQNLFKETVRDVCQNAYSINGVYFTEDLYETWHFILDEYFYEITGLLVNG